VKSAPVHDFMLRLNNQAAFEFMHGMPVGCRFRHVAGATGSGSTRAVVTRKQRGGHAAADGRRSGFLWHRCCLPKERRTSARRPDDEACPRGLTPALSGLHEPAQLLRCEMPTKHRPDGGA